MLNFVSNKCRHSQITSHIVYAVGLRQGKVMSPLLFSLFVKDIELNLHNDVNSGLVIDDIIIYYCYLLMSWLL